MTTKKRMSRRGFLAAAGLAAAPLILPSGAFGRDGRPGANSRLATGHIGLGTRGRALLSRLRASAVAVCDVDDANLSAGAHMTRPGTKTYTNYRELLESKDLDAVVIATPGHWHAVQCVQACEAGKDVFIETPVCLSPLEGRAMLRAAARFGSIVQTGHEGRFSPAMAAAQAHVASGALGKIGSVQCWGEPNPAGGNPEEDAPPPTGLRWELWLGPAPWSPYNAARTHGAWRWIMDLGGGQVFQQGTATFESLLHLLAIDRLGRLRVSAKGNAQERGIWDCPNPFEAHIELLEHGFTLSWTARPAGGTAPFGAVLQGASATLRMNRGDLETTTDAPAPGDGEAPAYQGDALQSWLSAVRTRSAVSAPLRAGVDAATLAALANLSWRLGRSITWDDVRGQCEDDAIANRLLQPQGKGPWRI